MKRTAREILINEEFIENKKVNVKIGTVANRNSPETIYIYTSFWIKPKDSYVNVNNLRSKLNHSLNKIHGPNSILKNYLQDNIYFVNEKENIFIVNIPDNFNYNNKSNFISIELYLHTLNINKETSLPLNNKKDTLLFEKTLEVANMICNDNSLINSEIFKFSKKSK